MSKHSESDTNKVAAGRLDRALRSARMAQADHLNAIFEIRDIQHLRLEALREDLENVIAEKPGAQDVSDLAIEASEPYRLWIDVLSYVIMEPDPRTYRFVQDTEEERQLIFETKDRPEMVKKITEYIAHRMIEQERLRTSREGKATTVFQSGYSGLALFFAWICGLSLGVLSLLVIWISLRGGS
ncbi:MAG: hypothetical protein ACR2OJ_07510 [Hyphomicrobiales bacterium]